MKLDIDSPSIRIVLEECGTEIEDDDILQFNEGKTLMFLQPGEIWTPFHRFLLFENRNRPISSLLSTYSLFHQEQMHLKSNTVILLNY